MVVQPSSLPFSRTFSSSQIKTLSSSNTNSPVSPPLIPWQPAFYFLSANFMTLGTSCKVDSYCIYPFVTGLFHLASHHQSASLLLHYVRIFFLFRLNNTSLFIYVSVSGHLGCFSPLASVSDGVTLGCTSIYSSPWFQLSWN